MPPAVVHERATEMGEWPTELVARTVTAYVVAGARPVTDSDVEPVSASETPSMYRRYAETGAPLPLGADQTAVMLVDVTPVHGSGLAGWSGTMGAVLQTM